MAEETKIPSELIISQKWDKLLERVAINARARRRAPPPTTPLPLPIGRAASKRFAAVRGAAVRARRCRCDGAAAMN